MFDDRFLPSDKSADDDNYTDVWRSLYRCVCVCVCVCVLYMRARVCVCVCVCVLLVH